MQFTHQIRKGLRRVSILQGMKGCTPNHRMVIVPYTDRELAFRRPGNKDKAHIQCIHIKNLRQLTKQEQMDEQLN